MAVGATTAVPTGGPAGSGSAAAARAGRLVAALLATAAALYVAVPVLQGAALPAVRAEFALSSGQVAVVKVAGAALSVVVLFAAGRAGDLWGRRRVLLVALGLLAAGGALLTVAFSDWSYLLGRGLVTVAVAAVFVTALAWLPALNAPGRLPRAMGGWLALMSLAFFACANLVPRTPSVPQLRLTAGVAVLVVLALLLAGRRWLPADDEGGARARLDRGLQTGAVLAVAAAVAALQTAPLRGWDDPLTLLLLAAVPVAAALAWWRGRTRSGERPLIALLPARLSAMALATGVAIGFTQLTLAAAVPVLAGHIGAGAAEAALMVSAFGAGGAAGGLLVRQHAVAPVTGCSLGLPLAAVGLALLHLLPAGTGAHLAIGMLAAGLAGLGVVVAQAPQMAWFLAALPRTRLGAAASFHPAAILLGAAAAQALPYTSALSRGPAPGDARQLLWLATAVVVGAALVAGLPAVALGVTAAAGGEYLLLRVLAGEHHAQSPLAVIAALAVGAGTGLALWSRRQQAVRLARARASATALQNAVLHPVPERLGGLRLAGRYRPATAGTGIGGDFYEAVHTPHGTRVMIGDVRGKGLQAVQSVTDLLGCFRSQAYETPDLGELAARLDRQTARTARARGDEELFATAFLLQHRPGEDHFEVLNHGHLAPLAVGPDGARELPAQARLPLGFGLLDGTEEPAPDRVALADGEVLLLHTDGLTEARNASGEFYPLPDRLARRATEPAELVDHLDTDVRDWVHRLGDDIALIAIGRPGAAT
ncbi:PP2C family protein-serine/threonine phosphatase [Kitasatospora sp. NPDC058965]|uniref:PP2C family protein-serine/threonine phosphatase n=1 Tax=Kitasatospora sp. NPDC058965 TaxID=3346682 RepID=UPI003697C133